MSRGIARTLNPRGSAGCLVELLVLDRDTFTILQSSSHFDDDVIRTLVAC